MLHIINQQLCIFSSITADGTTQTKTSVFTSDPENVILSWNYGDSDLLDLDVIDNIESMAFSVGSYPFGGDIRTTTYSNISIRQEESLSFRHIPLEEG